MSSAYPLTSPIEVAGTGIAPGQVNLSDGTFELQIIAPTGLTGNVVFTPPTAAGTANQVLMWPLVGSSTIWTDNHGNPNSTIPMSMRFVNNNNVATNTASAVFVVKGSFVYNGTNTDNDITDIIAIVQTSNAIATGEVTVFDLTNSLTIATSAVYGPTTGVDIIVNLGVISNLPVGQAIFEVQIRKVAAGAGTTGIRSIQLLG